MIILELPDDVALEIMTQLSGKVGSILKNKNFSVTPSAERPAAFFSLAKRSKVNVAKGTVLNHISSLPRDHEFHLTAVQRATGAGYSTVYAHVTALVKRNRLYRSTRKGFYRTPAL